MGWHVASSVCCVATIYLASESVCLIQQGNSALIERLGQFHRELTPGLHWKVPLVDRVAARYSLRERCLDVPPQKCITADNAPLEADAVVFYRIEDATKAKYTIDDFALGVQHLVLTQLRAEIGRLSLDATFSAREQLNAILLQEANARTRPWGVLITRVDVREIQPSREILKSMELQIAAERRKRAAILESQGQRTAAVNAARAQRSTSLLAADAEKQKLTTEATGIARAIDLVARALDHNSTLASRQRAADLLLDRQLLSAHHSLAHSSNTKILSLATPHFRRAVSEPSLTRRLYRHPLVTEKNNPGIVEAAVAAAAAIEESPPAVE